MHFLLSSMSVVYVLTTHIHEDGDDATVEQLRKRSKWDNDDYVCRGLILNEAKYMAEDASSKKFFVNNFTNYKMTDSRLVMEQYNELLDFKHNLKHPKEKLTLVELGSHLHIKESLGVQDSDKPKGNNVAGPSVVNMVDHNNFSRLYIVNDNIASAFMSTSKLNDSILWHSRLGHFYFKRMQYMSKDGLILAFDMDSEKCKTCMLTKITKKPFPNVKRKTEVLELIHSDLCDLHATPSLGNKKYFVAFIDDALRTESRVLGVVVRLPDPKLKIWVKEALNASLLDMLSILRLLVLRLNLSIPKETGDISGSVVPEKDDPKTFDEVMKSQDVAF
ncbi:zinc finger, CCHC-type containing protein [Tanacetum coccineum]